MNIIHEYHTLYSGCTGIQFAGSVSADTHREVYHFGKSVAKIMFPVIKELMSFISPLHCETFPVDSA